MPDPPRGGQRPQAIPLRMSLSGTGIWASPPILIGFTPTNWNTAQNFPVATVQEEVGV